MLPPMPDDHQPAAVVKSQAGLGHVTEGAQHSYPGALHALRACVSGFLCLKCQSHHFLADDLLTSGFCWSSSSGTASRPPKAELGALFVFPWHPERIYILLYQWLAVYPEYLLQGEISISSSMSGTEQTFTLLGEGRNGGTTKGDWARTDTKNKFVPGTAVSCVLTGVMFNQRLPAKEVKIKISLISYPRYRCFHGQVCYGCFLFPH